MIVEQKPFRDDALLGSPRTSGVGRQAATRLDRVGHPATEPSPADEIMKVCTLTSEYAPFARTGGLGDAVAGLTGYLHSEGVDQRIFMPAYASAKFDVRPVPVEFLQNLKVDLGPYRFAVSIDTVATPDNGPEVYLVRCPSLYNRPGIYDSRGDEHLRFALLARAALDTCQRMGFAPDVFHLHDWHTALVPIYLRTLYAWDRLFARSKTLVTIHNLAYQGGFPAQAAFEVGLGDSHDLLHQEELSHGVFRFLTTGILYADQLSAVSATYAREIQTPELGFGLDALLRARADHLHGLVNGVDYGAWNPETDRHLDHLYSVDDLSGKRSDKAALLADVDLPNLPGAMLAGIVSRLTAQKGFDLLMDPLVELLATRNLQLVVLGTGEEGLEAYFSALSRRFPRQVAFLCAFDNRMAHRIQAGSDVFLMPSRYEPCGLTQLYSLRYGTVPIVHHTGGLADTVQPWNPAQRSGTGFVFEHFDGHAVRWAIDAALRTFEHSEAWEALVRNGMSQDYSWQRQGRHYLALYRAMTTR